MPTRRKKSQRAARAARPQIPLAVDVLADEQVYILRALLPGVPAENLWIEFDGDQVRLSGEVPVLKDPARFLRREIPSGSFQENIQLPGEDVDLDRLAVQMEDGLLTLWIGRLEAAGEEQPEARPRPQGTFQIDPAEVEEQPQENFWSKSTWQYSENRYVNAYSRLLVVNQPKYSPGSPPEASLPGNIGKGDDV